MGHPGFGFIAIIAVAAYAYAVATSAVGTVGFVLARRVAGWDSRTAGRRVAYGIGAILAAGIVYAWLTIGGETATFVAILVGVTTVVTGVIPLGGAYFALSRLTTADDPLRLAVYGWTPSLAIPVAIVYLFGNTASTVGLAVIVVAPMVGPTAIGYAMHRF